MKPVAGMLGLFFDAAPHQQAVGPTILFPASDQRPVVQPLAFAARACGNPFPGQIRQAMRNHIHAPLLVIGPAHPLV
jgi:hypothetical protein